MAQTSRTADKRQAQLEALIESAEKRICAQGLASLKARDLAADIGVALGGLYNIVTDIDTLLLLITARTQKRLDAAFEAATGHLKVANRAEAIDCLVAIAHAYLTFARENLALWRMMFEVRISAPLPEWAAQDQLRLFRHIAGPLRLIAPDMDETALTVRARTLFASVHGIVSIGLEERLIAVPPQKLADEVEWLTRAACR